MLQAVLHTGAAFEPPVHDKWRPPTGEITWSSDGRRGEHAFLIASGDQVLSFSVDGDLEVLSIENGEASSVAGYTVAESSMWSHPALLENGMLVKDLTHLRLWDLSPP